MQGLGHQARGPHPRAAHLRNALPLVREQHFGSLHHPREHPDTVDQQPAVGGMVDRGLHTGPVQAQFAPFGHLCLDGQFHHAIIEGMQRLGAQRVLPAHQGGLVRHTLEVHPAEPAQHQAILHALFGFSIAPLIQMFAQQHAQQHFHRRGMPPMHQGPFIAFPQVITHLLVQLVIIQEPIQLLQHGIGLGGHFGHTGKHIF
jgi:hypothetical protein